MTELSQGDLDLLRRLAGAMIPPDTAHGAPGADDAAIFGQIAAGLQSRASLLAGLLADLGAGPALADLDGLRRKHGAAMALVIALTAQVYYRDDRVMDALGMDVRPPFPKGHEIIEGDWALLDAVRARPPIWRAAD